MRHRGPDDVGTHVAPGIAIGVRRLSIVDVVDGHQPFPNEDGSVWAAQNGELYEHARLRDELRSDGHSFTSRCDTEIIPHLYEALRRRVPASSSAGCSGSPSGTTRGVAPSSRATGSGSSRSTTRRPEIGSCSPPSSRACWRRGLVDLELDYAAIDAYLTLGFFPAPLTPLRGVRKLLPGHTLVVEDGTVSSERFWSYPARRPDAGPTIDEQAERLLAKLDESVRLRLMSDVPLGAMLSGGLDSSLIVALMARHMSEPVKTFAVGFAGAGETNELADARVRRRTSSAPTTTSSSCRSRTESTSRTCAGTWTSRSPTSPRSASARCPSSRRGTSPSRSPGQGADELFAGYRKHRAAAISGAFARATLGLGPRVARIARPRRGRRRGRDAAAPRPCRAPDRGEHAPFGAGARQLLVTRPARRS